MSLARRFLDLQLALEHRMTPGGFPPEMRDHSIPSQDDWDAWKPIPSTVTEEALSSFEQTMSVRLPQPFRDFLAHVHFLEVNATGVRFVGHTPDWKHEMAQEQRMQLLDQDGRTIGRASDLGLFVIGADQNDGGPVCLDLRRAQADGDCPVVFVDHETGERTTLFSSTDRMFACFALTAENFSKLLRANEGDPEALSQKRMLLRDFFALDPTGAGGPGRSFWLSAWGLREPVAGPPARP